MNQPTPYRSLRDRGSISIALYLHDGPAIEAMQWLVRQATTALESGFDGVTVSEHHAGFPGYLPTGVLAAARILGATGRGWAAPCPLLLPLRNPALVVEELAWLSAMHPDRVAAGLAAGYAEQDFAVVAAERSSANRIFRTQLEQWRELVDGEDSPLARDSAVAASLPSVPMVVCAGGPRNAAHAAEHGFGLMLPPQDPAKSAVTIASYDAAGGAGPKIQAQWVWVGTPPAAGIDRLRTAYPSADAQGNRLYSPEVMHSPNPQDVADHIGEDVVRGGLTGLNLRVHLPGVAPEETEEQIVAVARELVPLLRERLDIERA